MYKFPTQEGAASSAPTNAREIILLQSLFPSDAKPYRNATLFLGIDMVEHER